MNTAISTTVRAGATVPNCLHIEPHIYESLAEALLEKIGERDYLPPTMVDVEEGDLLFRFIGAAIIYYGIEYRPEGGVCNITNIVPIWWELHSFRGEVEVPNNAIFDRIKEYLIDKFNI